MRARRLVLALALAGAGALTGAAAATAAATAAAPPDPAATTDGEASAEAADDAAGRTTWALQPAGPEGPDERVSLRHELEPGTAASDLLALTNFSAAPAMFAVYASDGIITDDGLFDLLAPGETPIDGGSWVTVGPLDGATTRQAGGLLLEVPPGETVLVPVTIEVPRTATPGDHPAGVVAELVRGGDGGVQLAARVGVRVHLRVAGDVVARVGPERVTATWSPSWNPFAPGTVTVTFDVVNSGNVRVGADVLVSLAGPGGVAPAQARAEVRETLPGQAVPVTVEIPVAPVGVAWGEVTVTPVVVGEDVVDAPLAPQVASFAVNPVPVSQAAALVVLAGLVLAVRGLRRRSAARVQARIDAAVAAATAAREAERVGS